MDQKGEVDAVLQGRDDSAAHAVRCEAVLHNPERRLRGVRTIREALHGTLSRIRLHAGILLAEIGGGRFALFCASRIL